MMKKSLETFFKTIFKHKKKEEYIELRFFNRNEIAEKRDWVSSVSDAVKFVEDNSKDLNCYFGIHPRIEKAGTNAAVSSFSVLHVDLDFDKIHSQKTIAVEKIQEKIQTLGIHPTITVNSGRGIHLYFCLDRTYDWGEFQPVLIALITYFDGDMLKDKSRIFRVPGTSNVKKKPYLKCEILDVTSENRYSLQTIKDKLRLYIKEFVEVKSVVAPPNPLPPKLEVLGFKRYDTHWRDGTCPRCGHAGLYIYDNNPTEVICSHTGSCKLVWPVTKLIHLLEKKEKKSESVFNKTSFVRAIKEQPPALKMGYPKLDSIYKWRMGTFNLIASRLAGGKSSLAYNFLLNCAANYPESDFLFFTYEIPRELVQVRLLTIEYTRFAKKSVSFNDMIEEIKNDGPRAAAAIKRLERLNNIYVYDDPDLTLENMCDIIRESKNCGCAFIDYLECVPIEGKSFGSEELRVAHISTSLKKLAIKEKNFPIICLSQINRVPKERKDNRPTESDVRYSDKPGQDSTIMLGLYNPIQNKSIGAIKDKGGKFKEEQLVEAEDLPSVTDLEILGLKNRFGSRNREIMTFDMESGLVSSRKGPPSRTLPDALKNADIVVEEDEDE